MKPPPAKLSVSVSSPPSVLTWMFPVIDASGTSTAADSATSVAPYSNGGAGALVAQGGNLDFASGAVIDVRAGAKVYVSSRKADVVAETASELSKLGECIGIPADLSTEAECRRLADEISGQLDVCASPVW